MKNTDIRVRFAPSPTGPLHIGGVRTALYNYLFAKKNNGTFILRIEDTDQTRFVSGAEEYIIESLNWCGIKFDEGVSVGGPYSPYKQSERKEIYKKYADILVSSGNAYYAFDTPEELDKLRSQYESEKKTFSYDTHTRKNLKNSLTLPEDETHKLITDIPYTIRFKMPENQDVNLNDIIRGKITINTSTLDDKVIFKSDGLPTYHLANVVDDYLMKISHVIRGEEWLPSLPLHILLYKALGWEHEMPQFAHLPLILKPSGKGKLSKRDGDKDGFPVFPLEWKSAENDVSSGYRESGYFPEAFINMLAFLGWNPGTEQEIFSLEELTKSFSLDKVQKGGARFDPEKTKWFNQQYLRNKNVKDLALQFSSLLKEKNINTQQEEVEKICELVKDRAVFIHDLWEQSSFFFLRPGEYDEKVIKKFWKEDTPGLLNTVKDLIISSPDKSSKGLEETVKGFIESNELSFGKIMNPLRLCLVGTNKGPHLFDIIELIGIKETTERIDKALNEINM